MQTGQKGYQIRTIIFSLLSKYIKIRFDYFMRTENKLKIAVIGLGKMGINHVKMIKLRRYAEIVALADLSIDRARVSTFFDEIPPLFTSIEALYSSVKPDVVHIVTPPSTHYDLGKIALENDAHVFIEKPFVLKTRQAEELVQIAKSRGLQLFAGHQLLAHGATQKAECYVGNIGDIIHMESYFAFRKVRKTLSAVDQAVDILPHPVYTLLHFLKSKSDSKDRFNVKALEVEADGEIRAIIKHGRHIGVLLVTLKGRPVESYLKIVGTNGTVHIDYVRGVVTNMSGTGADALAAIINPYRQSWQAAWKTTKSLAGMALKKNRSYEGLPELIDDFYECIMEGKPSLIAPESIIATVAVCEAITLALKEKEARAELRAKARLAKAGGSLPSAELKGRVLVTGGTGFLGKTICRELRAEGWLVTAVSRTNPRYSEREAGVEYIALDLADGIPPEKLERVSAVIHCAAETSGGMEDHERNSVEATRKVMEAMKAAEVKRVIHISSLAVLKPGRYSGSCLDESSPVDIDNLSRGPYVWGKAKAEEIMADMSRRSGIEAKIIRPGPLVDFNSFEAPGRLGREVASYFVVMGSRKSRLSLCDVRTVAKVVRYYLSNYDEAPPVLNLVEPQPMTRQELLARLLETRKDLKALFIPDAVVRAISAALYVLQKIINPSRKPLSIAKAFSSESYNTVLAGEIISHTSSN